jgi:hypothetical protein
MTQLPPLPVAAPGAAAASPRPAAPAEAASAPAPALAGRAAPTLTPAGPVADAPEESPPADAEAAAIAAPPADATDKPVRKVTAEAVSLLQLVRDQMHRPPASRAARPEAASPVSLPDAAPATPVDPAVPDRAAVPVPPVTAPAAAPTALAPIATPANLSATLGARIVDMGVQGQWIDGLARDIAGLSANGAQGRFQIDAGALGPIGIDIRQGADGAAVSLTVASDLAEQALRQDSERLKLDAGLSAVRISEVKVERAAVPETARSDSAGQQASQQQSQSQGRPDAWGQPSAQGQMPHRQPRENFPSAHKGSGDPAVLNPEHAGGESADLPRARYA